MSSVLLATKLHLPALRPGHIRRELLLGRLDAGLARDARLVLLSAPAGYGKSSLLAEWISERKLAVAWLTLDAGDNDPARFVAYLIASIQTAHPDAGVTTLGMLNMGGALAPEPLLAPLMNDLADLADSLLIVLDDYHAIQNQLVHAAVAFLIEYLPAHIHLVIASRADPTLPLARLYGRGLVTEIRLADLRFDEVDAGRFLAAILQRPLPAAGVSTLVARTEGWVTGLQLAAHSLAGQSDTNAFVEAFGGSNRFVLDYLMEEVLDQQGEAVKEFLLQTSILGRMCGALCDAVTDRLGDSQAILENLERSNLFTVPLDDVRGWYRYHHLFGDLLRQRLQHTAGELVPLLHSRASQWYSQAGCTEEAIDHALAANDTGQAAALVATAAEAIFMRSEAATFMHWIDRLPAEAIRQQPSLGAYHAWALLWQAAPVSAVEQRLRAAVEAGAAPADVLPVEAILALYRGDMARGAMLARRALEELPADALLMRSLASLMQGVARMAPGDEEEGAYLLEELATRSQAVNNTLIAATTLCSLGELRQKQGDLQRAQAYYADALELATDAHRRPMPAAGMAMIGLADLARERDDLEAARQQAKEGIALVEQWSPMAAFDGYVTLLRIAMAQGDRQNASATLHRLRAIAVAFDISVLDDYVVEMLEAHAAIAAGNLTIARRWAERRGLAGRGAPAIAAQTEDGTVARLRKYELMVLARLRCAEKRFADAQGLLDAVVRESESTGRTTLLLEASILRAEVYASMGDMARAQVDFKHALQIARPAGYLRIFLDEGEAIRPLLTAARKACNDDSQLPAYIQQILDALPQPAAAGAAHQDTTDEHLIETLSAREQEVLCLIAEGLTNQEIAERLVISLRTVKFHTSNIFAKLAVSNRTQAVARARDLALL